MSKEPSPKADRQRELGDMNRARRNEDARRMAAELQARDRQGIPHPKPAKKLAKKKAKAK